MRRLLERQGYRVWTAGNGVEAIEVFTAHRADIRIVVTDVMMAVMDGVGLCRELRARAPLLPVVVMSGLADPKRADELRRLGVTEFLSKPSDVYGVIMAIRRGLGQEA